MIWHNETPERRISRGTLLAMCVILLFIVLMLIGATHVQPVGATEPQGVMYLTCDKDYCQVDVIFSGRDEPIEFLVKRVVYTEVRA